MKYIDLHLHLDGSLSIASVRKLAELQNIKLDMTDDEIRSRLTVPADCPDLNTYLKCFEFPGSLLQTAPAITMAMRTLITELRDLGYMYAEIRFAPQKHMEKGLTMEEVVEAAIAGLDNSIMPAQLILCCMRGDYNEAENLKTVQLVHKYQDKGVCAADLAGAEALFPTFFYSPIFEIARQYCERITIHAGEASGCMSIKAAVAIGAERIGHGVNILQEPELLAKVVERQTPLELCPTSNLQTGIFPDMKSFPIHTLMDAGVKVTVNSDNMAVSGTWQGKELELLKEAVGLTDAEIMQIQRNAIEASFASDELKARLIAELEAEA